MGLGVAHGHELPARARTLGMPAPALTDDSLCSPLEFARLSFASFVQPLRSTASYALAHVARRDDDHPVLCLDPVAVSADGDHCVMPLVCCLGVR